MPLGDLILQDRDLYQLCALLPIVREGGKPIERHAILLGELRND